MNSLPVASTIAPSPASQYEGGGLEETNLDEFLKLMIAELQNQDPLNPMENSEMLQQLSQMRSIGANERLTDTLDAVRIGQNVTTASSLIGKQIRALSDSGTNIGGIVDRVTVAAEGEDEPGSVRVHIGQESVALHNVREILPATQT
jgi:flagellar basal-body rod modification protein FlgD